MDAGDPDGRSKFPPGSVHHLPRVCLSLPQTKQEEGQG